MDDVLTGAGTRPCHTTHPTHVRPYLYFSSSSVVSFLIFGVVVQGSVHPAGFRFGDVMPIMLV